MSDTDRTQSLRNAYVEWSRQTEGAAPCGPDVDEFVNTTYRSLVASGDDLSPDVFPSLDNLSSAFLFRFLPIPHDRRSPEFLYVPALGRGMAQGEENTKITLFIAQWNTCWESGQLRHEMFDDDVPKSLLWLRENADHNIYLLPRAETHCYYAYAPLFHMLPGRLLDRYGLPPFRRGLWPHTMEDAWREHLIATDFDERLSAAFADFVWSSIDSGSGLSAFSETDPLRLLAHNLDFWLPYAYQLVEQRLASLPRVAVEDENQAADLARGRQGIPEAVALERPRKGGNLWCGESDAQEALGELIDAADAHGRLRAIIDAIRSNRVEDDFSSRWSYAKEDFERKLYRKRAKVSVSFVEINDTVPVHGPESEVIGNLLWEDFLGLLNQKERHITVLLRNGHTRLADIATEMGYANHSPVSKALARIRRKAQQYLDC